MRPHARDLLRVLGVLNAEEKSGRDKLEGVLRYAYTNGRWDLRVLKFHTGAPDPARLAEDIARLAGWAADGIVIGNLPYASVVELLLDRLPGIPVASLDSNLQAVRVTLAHRGHAVVSHDPLSLGSAAVDHFLRQGFRHFAYVGAVDDAEWSCARGEAFAAKAREAGCDCRVYGQRGPGEEERGGSETERMKAWVTGLSKPVALLAANDMRAKDALDACLRAGLGVPRDVGILGVDNDEIVCENTHPKLSSVVPDFEAAGFLAAERLDSLMRGLPRGEAGDIRYGVKQIVQRGSSVFIQPSNRVAAAALGFIQDRACTGIGVMNVARRLRVSRRLAEMRFREAYGCSILEKIQEIRLARVRSLLCEGHLPISEIGAKCGYRTESYLKGLFKKRFGMTMRDYRRYVTAKPQPH